MMMCASDIAINGNSCTIKIETGRSRAEFLECEWMFEIGGQHTALL